MHLANVFKQITYGLPALRIARNRKVLFYFAINNLVLVLKRIVRTSWRFSKKVLPHKCKQVLWRWFGNPATRPRRYIANELSVEGFFKELKNRNVEYVVLRWFEDLPSVAPGEDIDILIQDHDLGKTSDLLSTDERNQAIDVYSVSGLSGSNFRQVPYYPPHLALELLESRVRINGIYAVPNQEHHFLSLAYHAVFHKGASNLEHDYLAILKKLSPSDAATQASSNYDSLIAHLRDSRWVPELDTLRILSKGSPWLQDQIPQPNILTGEGEIIVFAVREWALKEDKLGVIIQRLERARLEVLDVLRLNDEEKARAKRSVRGGKWDRGPYIICGGDPVVLVICYDYHPESPSSSELKLYPYIRNRHSLVKHSIRNHLNAELIFFSQTNCIHSSDDEMEAWNYVERVVPSHLPKLRNQISDRKRMYRTTYPVLHLYRSNRTRAKIEKIKFNGNIAVKKTFKHGQERFAHRENYVYRVFSKLSSAVPPLLESGENYIIIPWYDNILENRSTSDKKTLMRPFRQQVIEALRLFYDKGFAMIGFYPGNLIITPDNELKLIDFEFLYEYAEKPSNFTQSYDISGIPKDFDGDLPRGIHSPGHTYKNTWKPIFGPLDPSG